MRNKSYALLISGIFSVMLIPSVHAIEGGYPDSFSWRPVANQNIHPSSGKGLFRQAGHNIMQGSAQKRWGRNYPQQVQHSYRFRPWSGRHPQTYHPATGNLPTAGLAAHDRPGTPYQTPYHGPIPQPPTYTRHAMPMASSGYPGYGFYNPYSFRPLDQQPRDDVADRWTYRPAQVEIPNHYVYRPLKTRSSRYRGDLYPRGMAPRPGVNDVAARTQEPVYHGYQLSRMPMPYWVASYPQPDYYSGSYYYPVPYNRYATNRTMGGNPSLVGRVGEQRARSSSAPRYTGQAPYSRYRFRPMNRPQWRSYSYPQQPEMYTANPYPAASYRPALHNRVPYNTMMPGRPPYAVMHYPGMQNSAAPNRHGVDWYDGMGDGEGAWYKLTEQQAWPRVSQYLPLD